MAAVGVAGMVGTIGSSAVDGAANADKLRQNIKDIETKTANLKSRFDEVISEAVQYDSDIEREMRETVDSIGQIKAEMVVTKDNFLKCKQRIETIGVTFLVYLFTILLLKRIGILDGFAHTFYSLAFAPVPKKTKVVFHKASVHKATPPPK